MKKQDSAIGIKVEIPKAADWLERYGTVISHRGKIVSVRMDSGRVLTFFLTDCKPVRLG
jgi:hypothetical protein